MRAKIKGWAWAVCGDPCLKRQDWRGWGRTISVSGSLGYIVKPCVISKLQGEKKERENLKAGPYLFRTPNLDFLSLRFVWMILFRNAGWGKKQLWCKSSPQQKDLGQRELKRPKGALWAWSHDERIRVPGSLQGLKDCKGQVGLTLVWSETRSMKFLCVADRTPGLLNYMPSSLLKFMDFLFLVSDRALPSP